MSKVYENGKVETVVKELGKTLDKKWSSVDLFGDPIPFSVSPIWKDQMSHIPMENLEKMLQLSMADTKSRNISDVYKMWGNNGLLEFAPYIQDVDGIPTLVLRHDQYMQWLRDSSFTISADPLCGSSEARGCIGMEQMLWDTAIEPYKDVASFYKAICWAAVIDTGFYSRSFRNYFFKWDKQIPAWLTATLAAHKVPITCDYSDIMKYLKWELRKPVDLEDYDIYALQVHGTVYGILYKKGLRYVCEIKKGLHSIYGVFNVSALGAVLDTCSAEYVGDELLLLIAFLNLCGIRVQWNTLYTVDKLYPLPLPNYPDVKEVTCLKDLMN